MGLVFSRRPSENNISVPKVREPVNNQLVLENALDQVRM